MSGEDKAAKDGEAAMGGKASDKAAKTFVPLTARSRVKPPKHLSGMTIAERQEAITELGVPKFRADQISRQWFTRLEDDPSKWTDLPDDLANKVKDELLPPLFSSVKEVTCDNGQTVKTVLRLHDNALVESVLMRYPGRVTMCVSSQAGCGMGCPFCATGQGGLTRNLSAAEIVEQVVAGARLLSRGQVAGGPGKVSNIVLMGMGEPLANYNNVVKALRILVSPNPEGLDIPRRGVTVSTVGLVPRMRQLATEGLPFTLALSLHAPDDELRDELVPINNRFPVEEVLDAAWEYAGKTKRRVSIEYAMMRDINDQPERARLLAQLLKGKLVHVNLIPLNPTPGSKWTASRQEDEDEFVAILERHGVPVTVRDTRGQEIDAACGQLAASTA